MATNIFIVLLHFLLLAMAAKPLPPPSQQSGCVAQLVAFSPCLPFVSAPPNNVTDFAAPQCCNAFSSAFESGEGYCFCYVLRQPLIFGFPLNETRVASLSAFCMAKNGSTSLDSLCSSALSPLPSTTESGRSKPSNSDSGNDSYALTYSPPESAVRSPTPPSSSVVQAIFSSATNQIYKHNHWFLLGMIICCFATFTSSLTVV